MSIQRHSPGYLHVLVDLDLAHADLVETALEKAVRSAVDDEWGKKPICHVQIVVV